VSWPSGHEQVFEQVAVNQKLTITEPAGATSPERTDASTRPTQFVESSEASGLALRSSEEPVDETTLQRLLPARLNRRGPSVAVTELNEGGHTLVAVGGTTQSPLRILMRTAKEPFRDMESATFPVDPVNDGPLLFFDTNADGRNDLLVSKGGNTQPAGAAEYQPKLYLGDDQGGFRIAPEGTLPTFAHSAGAVVAADFDRNGRLDVFIGGRVNTGQYPLAPMSALFANHGGKFEDVTDTLAPALREIGMVTAALASDVDGDGWIDLLLTLDWGHVTYFHNNQGQGFEDRTDQAGFAAAGTGWWTSLASADFNGDSRPDYAVGNLGLNTQYRADAKHPALLFSGDFKGGGGNQLIEGYYEGEKLYPWRSRRDLGAAVPAVLKKYPRNDFFARAMLGEIFGEDKLAKAQRFAVTELRSGVFLSQSDGTYRFEPLPRLAQISPLQGTVAGDFDGDGRADIYAVQNSYAPIPAVGRHDGGLSQLLRGDGRGNFSAVPIAESGLLVPGDAKALVTLDLDHDGWPDFFVSRNHDTTLAFHNQPISGRHSLRVQLRGATGNPSAVGARITVEYANGSAQTSEVFAGSGYYSQSSAACFFGWTDANPPTQMRVRWPSGVSSHHPFASGSSSLTLTAP